MARESGKIPASQRHRHVLGCLVICAFGVSLTNLVIGHRAYFLHDAVGYLEQQSYQQQKPDNLKEERTPLLFGEYAEAGGEIIHDGEYISKILQGDEHWPTTLPDKNNNNNPQRLKFHPGSLPLSSAQTLQKCFVNLTHYGKQIPDKPVMLASVSDTHKLIYRNIPKSSSSSARHAMQDFLDGNDRRVKHEELEMAVYQLNYSMISFIRDPLNRFYSSYDESYFRMGPWMGDGPIVADKPRVKKWYHENKYRMEKYPYLYEGFKTIKQFREVYCPPEVLGRKVNDCNDVPSIENGTLSHRFEKFVRDYNGRDPFDVHLYLQTASLVWGITGRPLPITKLYNSTEAEKGWQEIAHEKGVHIPEGEMTHGRKITRRFNVSRVSDGTKRKICHLMALDYCCLNLKLPEVCRKAVGEEAVFCALDKIPSTEVGIDDGDEEIVIQPWRNL